MKNASRSEMIATKESIKIVALQLMHQNKKTTTLEVKRALRGIGYIAYQESVSYWMDCLASDLGWTYTFNGHYRTYRLETIPHSEDWIDELLTICQN